MLKRLNPDILIGILLGTLFWVGVFVWQSSQSLPYTGQPGEVCKGSKAECAKASVDERLANYTWWLAVLTAGLVVTAIGQGYFLLRADKTSRIAADAARKGAEVAEKSLTSTERAFVFLKYAYASPVFTTDKKIGGWDFHVVWENAGPTPTQHMLTYKNLLQFSGEMPLDFPFPDIVSGSAAKKTKPTFIGPKSTVDAGAQFVPLGRIERGGVRTGQTVRVGLD